MHVERLRLTDFRNYPELELELPAGLIVLRGRNAQGKSNVLEAVALLATTRSFRTTTEREAVRWGAPGHFARLDGVVARRADRVHIEIVIADATMAGLVGTAGEAGTGGGASAMSAPAPFRKRIRVNGTPRRAMDLLGQMTVVVFTPRDLDLVAGEPSQRRRFLDLTLCQVNSAYCRTLSQYQKVIAQRAALLRRIRDGEESPHALAYWDDQLARLAIPIMRDRAAFLARAGASAARVYAMLARDEQGSGPDATSGTGDDMDNREGGSARDSIPAATPGELLVEYRPTYKGTLGGDENAAIASMLAELGSLRRREIAQGANVLGPHRDDVAFLLRLPTGAVDLAVYGSRGQQRSVALALKLAELEYIQAMTGDQPILLLDDVLSELDAQRRVDLLLAVRDVEQVLLTTTDTDTIPAEMLARARVYEVRAAQVVEVEVA